MGQFGVFTLVEAWKYDAVLCLQAIYSVSQHYYIDYVAVCDGTTVVQPISRYRRYLHVVCQAEFLHAGKYRLAR